MMLRCLPAALAFALALAGAAAAPPPPAPATPPASPAALPAGPGRDTVIRVCSGCHAPEIVMPQRLSPADWDKMVESMAGNGAQATEAEFAAIKAYLAKAFPASIE